MPRVSVIIPTYNRKEWLQQAIDSVLDQTYSDFELIVVDDGSTDGTKEILQSKYQDQIRYVYQENQGESKARNNGANIGTGEFLAFLDSDDLWLPMKLQQQVDYLDHHQEVGAVFCLAWSINETGQLNPRFPYGHQFLASEFSLKRILRDPSALGGNSTVVIRKTAFNHLGGFDEKITYGEDFDFCLRLFSCGFQPVLMRSPLASIRTHSSSQSISLNTKKIDQELSDHLIIYNKVKATNSEKEINDYTEVARLKKYFKVFGYYLYTSDHLNVLKFQKIIKEEFPAGLSNEKMYDRIIDYYIPRVFESTHDQKKTIEFVELILTEKRKYIQTGSVNNSMALIRTRVWCALRGNMSEFISAILFVLSAPWKEPRILLNKQYVVWLLKLLFGRQAGFVLKLRILIMYKSSYFSNKLRKIIL